MTQRKVQYYVIPPERNAEFAAHMENVIELYGSWLNVSECDLSVLTAQCVKHCRFGTIEELRKAVLAWSAARNEQGKGIDWQFDIEKARAKLKSLYPIIE